MMGAGMLSCRVDGPLATSPAGRSGHSPGWVRTVDGWERVDTWHLHSAGPPPLHPLVVAAGQGLVSLLGLAACGRER